MHSMKVDFESLPDTSRIWIYQADRELTDDELEIASKMLSEFVISWNSHGTDLVSSFTIKNRLHIILGTNEEGSSASGCSIDKSVNTIKLISKNIGVDFFNRNIIYYFQENILSKTTVSEFKNLLKTGKLSVNTAFFNNTITEKSQLKSDWIIEANKSWLKNMIN